MTIGKNYQNIFYTYLLGWNGTNSIITGATYWPTVPTLDDNNYRGEIRGMSDWQGKIKHSEKTCTSAALSTTNPT
jgi:hypothetical protein